jgi:transmembrane sensor
MTDTSAPSALEDQAVELLVQLHSGRASAVDHLAYRQWRKRSAAHEQAACEAEALWGALPQTLTAQQFSAPLVARRRHRRLAWASALAACLALMIAGSGVFGPWQRLYAEHVTALTERRHLTLEDGSQIWLNGSTQLSVSYSARRREITLYGGEALFEVAKDAARPFVVSAADGEVQAIGTRFNVDLRGSRVAVAVSEGVVQVSSAGQVVRLPAGQALTYQQGLVPAPSTAVDRRSVAAWQRGKLIFNARPLGEVLSELDRYLPGLLYLTDTQLAQRRISGVFELDDPQTVLQILEQTQPLRITRLPLLTLVRPQG